MCNSTFSTDANAPADPQPTIPGLADPFDSDDGLAVRPIPSTLPELLAVWGEDITRGAAARHERGLRPREVRAINAGLGEARTVYGTVSVLKDGFSSAKATVDLIQARIARIDADQEAAAEAGDRKLSRVHAVRAFTVRMLLIELRVSLAGGGFVVAIPTV